MVNLKEGKKEKKPRNKSKWEKKKTDVDVADPDSTTLTAGATRTDETPVGRRSLSGRGESEVTRTSS